MKFNLMKKFLLFFFAILIFLFFGIGNMLYADVIIRGKVLSDVDKKGVPLASVLFLNAKKKTRTNKQGEFQIALPYQKEYTILIRFVEFQNYQETILASRDNTTIQKSFLLKPRKFRSQAIRVQEKRPKQELSRRTLSKEQIKLIPASFGDSLNAITALPGITRSSGTFFGDIILRGVNERGQQYYIDKIPVLYPQHLGALQSIISNDLIENLDVYGSGFPLEYGRSYGGIIEIETIDDVKDFEGYAETASLYTGVYLQGVIPAINKKTLENAQSKNTQSKKISNSNKKANTKNLTSNNSSASSQDNLGYWIASVRVGYLGWTTLPIIRAATGRDIPDIQYFDYQTKLKFFLDKKGKHSLTTLIFGSFDYFNFQVTRTRQEQEEDIGMGVNPLFSSDRGLRNDLSTNAQAIYYKYEPSRRINNTLFIYNLINYSFFLVENESVNRLTNEDRGYNLRVYPNTTSIQNDFVWEYWENISRLSVSVGYELYWFIANGKTQVLREEFAGGNPPTIDEFQNNIMPIHLDFIQLHHNIKALVKLDFAYMGFFTDLGVRLEYLASTNDFIADPRFLIGYEFQTQTSISARTGLYQSFPQTNFAYFTDFFEQNIFVVQADYLEPERGFHNTLGIKQNFLELYTFSLEGFANFFDRYLQNYVQLEERRYFINSANVRNFGLEVLFEKRIEKNKQDFFGWLSYTYTYSKIKTNLPNDSLKDVYIPSEFEQNHALKIVLGYNFVQNSKKQHVLSLRFELYSGFPYTPIVGSSVNQQASAIYNYTVYNPQFGEKRSANYPIQHRLDIRYTYSQIMKWGTFKFYLEVVNVYYFQAISSIDWKYNQPYQAGTNPNFVSSNQANQGLPVIPSIGFEFIF